MVTFFAHGTSLDNELGLRSGWNDPPLSALGRKQAADLSSFLRRPSYDLIFASDLRRALETARIAFSDSEIQPDERLREMNYGELNGSPAGDFPVDEEWCIDNRFPSGESCHDVQVRVRDFLDERVPVSARVAIISHNYPQLALEVILNGLTWQEAIRSDWRTKGAWQPGWHYSDR